MKKIKFQGITAVVVLLFSICVFGEESAESTVPSNEKIYQILIERLGESADRIGIVVGVLEPSGRLLHFDSDER